MTELIGSLLGLLVRLGLLVAGLAFFGGLVFIAWVLLMVWMLRSLWAKLTGQPVTPWIFQFNRRPPWQRADQGFGAARSSSADDVIDAEVRDVNVVTDIEPKRIDPPR
jgi:hypothetical protein